MERSYIPVLMLECCDPPTEGLESVLVNELAVGLRWRAVKAWKWRRPVHISGCWVKLRTACMPTCPTARQADAG